MYAIDLQTILRVLKRQSGELRAEVRQIAGIKDVCQASVKLSSGKIAACTVSHAGHPVLSGEAAVRALADKGILEWEYIPSGSTQSLPLQVAPRLPPEPSLPVSPVPLSQELLLPWGRAPTPYPRPLSAEHILPMMVPVQALKVSREELANWPRSYRAVYQLAQGEKSVAEIAQLLSLTPEQIKAVLLFFLRRNIITV